MCGEFMCVRITIQIEKKEVDDFKTGKRIPSCQLIAECKTEKPANLKHSVMLSGAKDPHAAFLIYRRCMHIIVHKYGSIYPTPHIMHTYTYTLLTTKHILLVFLP